MLAKGKRRRRCQPSAVLPLVRRAHGNVREIVVHLAAKGAGYFQKGELIAEPPVPAKTQVNTTGTGDVLSLCMILLHHQTEMSIQEELRLANTIVSEFIEGKRQFIPTISG